MRAVSKWIKDTMLVAVSDGVVHAGVGHSLDLGWEWVNVNSYLRNMSKDDGFHKGSCQQRP